MDKADEEKVNKSLELMVLRIPEKLCEYEFFVVVVVISCTL